MARWWWWRRRHPKGGRWQVATAAPRATSLVVILWLLSKRAASSGHGVCYCGVVVWCCLWRLVSLKRATLRVVQKPKWRGH
jgi:hypothetical protein